MFKWLVYFPLLLTLAVLAACGNNSGEKNTGSEEGVNGEASTYTVEHAMGTTEVPENPEKIVILTNEGTEALLAMEVKPIGAVQSWLGDPWYEHISDDMEGVENVGLESEPSLEKIAALEPDLIIGNKLRHEKIYNKLESIAPTVYSETLKGEWKENFEFYAKALNKEAEGQKVLEKYNDRVAELKEKLGDKTNQEVSVVRFMAGQTRIYYTDSFSGVILGELGFKRPSNLEELFATQPDDQFAYTSENKEIIPEMDGDILFYFTYADKETKADAEKWAKDWTKDPLWQNLEVVKADNAYEVSDTIWNTAGGVKAANLLLDDIEKFFLEQ
ncbi:ABC transporter substrate-binding protein [Rossellomorea sp. BNER]|uniref:ABC transporter substrate-binding protein n=1 Tax=Rossellomorea sp. BNER TaxID=2962031 RepID=UPI003AF2AE89|nr:iron-siderophore ABC transporter substrate-binding protein [Rossellomorea sp. BNER]